MSGHEDRLAGLVVVSAALTGNPTVVVRGTSAQRLARGVGGTIEVADEPTSGAGAVVVGRGAVDAAAKVDALHRFPRRRHPVLVWVLWDGHGAAAVHRAAGRAGLEKVAAYRYVGAHASPTHLVREGPGHALRWFATSARPRWGARSRLARRGNYLPGIGHQFFDGKAVLYRAVEGTTLTWPGAEFARHDARHDTRHDAQHDARHDARHDAQHDPRHRDEPADDAPAPAVVHLGGGATSGRLVLTWADGSGAPTHHTKLAPPHLTDELVAEANALRVLAGIPEVEGTVPTLLGLRRGPTSAALTATHLPGRPPSTSPAPRALRRVVPWRGRQGGDVDSLVTDWLAALALSSKGRTPPALGATASAGQLAGALDAIDDPTLQAVVRRGVALGATSEGLLHGDLWPGNVHRIEAPDGATRIAVLDWESALVGHPLVDLLTWLVHGSADGGPIRQKALATLGALTSEGRAVVGCVNTLLDSLGQALEPLEVEALVLAQMVVIAVAGGPLGGQVTHQRAWLEAVRAVWSSWQLAGGSPWSLPEAVAR